MLDNQLLEDILLKKITDITPGLERITQVLSLLDNPQDCYQVIHIAGTNGKGSVASFIESGLILSGYNVAKFTSPHIYQINECISVNHNLITDNELNRTYFRIKNVLTINNLQLSPFEFLTVILFEYCKDKQIDWLVLECGMGGLLDATNVINSKYAIITNIGLEHTAFLGNTLHDIALHKLGIIKSGMTIIGSNEAELLNNLPHNNYICIERDYNYSVQLDKDNLQTILTFGEQVFHIGMLGYFQAVNFLCAYTVFKDMGVNLQIVHQVAKQTNWQYRLQVISNDPIVILDATHNELGAIAIYQTLSQLYSRDEVVIVTSILKDKSISAILDIFSQIGDRIVLTSINNPRGSQAFELALLAEGKFKHIYTESIPKQAIKLAQSLQSKVILVTGSLYLLSELKL